MSDKHRKLMSEILNSFEICKTIILVIIKIPQKNHGFVLFTRVVPVTVMLTSIIEQNKRKSVSE